MMDDFPTTEVNQPKNPHKRDLKITRSCIPNHKNLEDDLWCPFLAFLWHQRFTDDIFDRLIHAYKLSGWADPESEIDFELDNFILK